MGVVVGGAGDGDGCDGGGDDDGVDYWLMRN